MPLYRKTRVLGAAIAPTKEKDIVKQYTLPSAVTSTKWFFVPVEVMNRKSLLKPQPTPVPVDRKVSERTVRRIIRQMQNVQTLKGYEILCEVDGQLYTNRRQVYGAVAQIIK